MRTHFLFTVLATSMMILGSPESVADEHTNWRPIEDFLVSQGTFCWRDMYGDCLFFLPGIARNFAIFSDLEFDRCAVVDYAGIVADYLAQESGGAIDYGTNSWGTVKEKVLADGTTEVTVILRTENAITWVVDGCDIAAGSPLYGFRYDQLLEGAEPSLSDITIQATFTNIAEGAPIPDMLSIFYTPAANPVMLSFTMEADGCGQFNSAYGVPDGTPGRFRAISRAKGTGSNKKALIECSIDLNAASN